MDVLYNEENHMFFYVFTDLLAKTQVVEVNVLTWTGNTIVAHLLNWQYGSMGIPFNTL